MLKIIHRTFFYSLCPHSLEHPLEHPSEHTYEHLGINDYKMDNSSLKGIQLLNFKIVNKRSTKITNHIT